MKEREEQNMKLWNRNWEKANVVSTHIKSLLKETTVEDENKAAKKGPLKPSVEIMKVEYTDSKLS